MKFDPYETWLGIPADRRPPTHYDLLGLAPSESEAATIDQAALRRMSKVRQYQLGPQSDLAQEVLAELARARLILMDPNRRAAYESKVRARGEPPLVPDALPQKAPKSEAPRHLPIHQDDPSELFASLAVTDREADSAGRLSSTSKNGFILLRRGLLLASVVASHGAILWGLYHFVYNYKSSNHQAGNAVPNITAGPVPTASPKRQPLPSRRDVRKKPQPPQSNVAQWPIGIPDGVRTAQSEKPDPSATDGLLEEKPLVDARPKTEGPTIPGDPDLASKKIGRAVGSTPKQRLESLGLRLVGSRYVLQQESVVRQKLEQARSIFDAYSSALSQKEEIRTTIATAAGLQEQIDSLTREIDLLDQSLRTQPPLYSNLQKEADANARRHRESLVGERINAVDQLKRIQRQLPNQPGALQEVHARIRSLLPECESVLAELREFIRSTDLNYMELEKNEDAKAAIAESEQRTKAKLRLGASLDYVDMQKQARRLEKALENPASLSPARGRKRPNSR